MIIRVLFISLACVCAIARTPEGLLGALRMPNNARPAMVHAGESFMVEALRRGELRMTNNATQYALAPEWKDGADGIARATVVLPAEAAPGAYALEWSEGDEGDQNTRSVFVLPAIEQSNPFSQQYAFACASIDFNDGGSKGAMDSIAAIDPAQAQFVVLFAHGGEERYAEMLTAIDASPVPTIVVIDATESVARRWFGPRTFVTRYGPDAFLAAAQGADGLGDELGTAPETFARLRRDCKDARWKVGLFSGADANAATRNEITLEVDNAFHVRLFGAAATTPEAQRRAWAGWFDAPRDYALPANRIVIFAANFKEIKPAKTAAKSP